MARPWQENLVAHKLPEALQAAGVGMILNLQVVLHVIVLPLAQGEPHCAKMCQLDKTRWNDVQEVGEHAHCGRGILPASGFSYDPEAFMAANIGVYNFSWRDMGVPTLFKMMDIVQVQHFLFCNWSKELCLLCATILRHTLLQSILYICYSLNQTAIEQSCCPGTMKCHVAGHGACDSGAAAEDSCPLPCRLGPYWVSHICDALPQN